MLRDENSIDLVCSGRVPLRVRRICQFIRLPPRLRAILILHRRLGRQPISGQSRRRICRRLLLWRRV